MMPRRPFLSTFIAASSFGALLVCAPSASAASPSRFTVEQSQPVAPTTSPALRDLPPAKFSKSGTPRRARVARPSLGLGAGQPEVPITLLDFTREPKKRTPTPMQVFQGISFTGSHPPDPTGDVGPNHYMQAVNTSVAVYDKNGNELVAPKDLANLWTGQNNDCNSDGGDPIVLYDSAADRWMVTQLGSMTNAVCMAISKTSDPGGQYHAYRFAVPQLPDYLKFGVWTDGYYMGDNENTYNVYAFDRAKLLQGSIATFQRITGETNLLLPADIDGPTMPPAGAPEYFYTFKDDQEHGGQDRLEVFEFDVDWANAANTTFNLVASIPIAPFNYTVCGAFNFLCIPQKGTNQRLDSISEWPMFKLQYRNFGAYESLVGNFTVDVDNTNHAGIRWFELRKTGAGAWSLVQEGTHAPDALHRFIGSVAMDKVGNLAIGYTAVGTNSFPDIRIATRSFEDPLGTLQAEVTMMASNGSQTGVERWGDYSHMAIDPTDDCTFYYTNEYMPSQGGGWNTAVGKFRMPNCGGKDVGESCTNPSDCKSGFCADSVCCSSDCGADPMDCQVCSVAAGGAADGTCTTLAKGVDCRPALSACDVVEECDGVAKTCPADQFLPATTVCRKKAGDCDVEEVCTGKSGDCPADSISPAGTVCRPVASATCDVQEVCDGASNACPADMTSMDGGECEGGGTCKAGACVPPLQIDPEEDSSCGCRIPGASKSGPEGQFAALMALFGMSAIGAWRRRNKKSK